jgi:hypothetical protein
MISHGGSEIFYLENYGKIKISINDHLATGGEGSVYKYDNKIVKIYNDSHKMIQDRMVEKIRLLASLMRHKYISAPRGVVTDKRNIPVGLWLDFVEGEGLSRIFTNSFRDRIGFGTDESIMLTERMQQVFHHAHKQGAFLVDPNEMNWLVNIAKNEPKEIDVDSWAIGSWPPKVIMNSIRDWHSNEFNQMTDWFAWAIVSFQIFCGIHPYGGKLEGYRFGDCESRMKNNDSVFNPKTKLNANVRDFSEIPGPLLDWYFNTFENGLRDTPPSPFEKGFAKFDLAKTIKVTVDKNSTLVYEKIFERTNDPVLRVFSCGVVMTRSGKLFDLATRNQIGEAMNRDCEVIAVEGGWLKGDNLAGKISFSYISKQDRKETRLDLSVKARKIFRHQNRMFIVSAKGLSEVHLTKLGRPIISIGNTWGVLINSVSWFDGVGVLDALGAMYLVLPFGDKSCAQVRVKEIDQMKIVVAKAGEGFVTMIAVDKAGNYHKLELTFNERCDDYQLWRGKADFPELNIAILPKGVCATVIDDGEINIFVPKTQQVKKIRDSKITTRMYLSNWDNKVIYNLDGGVWQVRMT